MQRIEMAMESPGQQLRVRSTEQFRLAPQDILRGLLYGLCNHNRPDREGARPGMKMQAKAQMLTNHYREPDLPADDASLPSAAVEVTVIKNKELIQKSANRHRNAHYITPLFPNNKRQSLQPYYYYITHR